MHAYREIAEALAQGKVVKRRLPPSKNEKGQKMYPVAFGDSGIMELPLMEFFRPADSTAADVNKMNCSAANKAHMRLKMAANSFLKLQVCGFRGSATCTIVQKWSSCTRVHLTYTVVACGG